jgi:hypothetical protein
MELSQPLLQLPASCTVTPVLSASVLQSLLTIDSLSCALDSSSRVIRLRALELIVASGPVSRLQPLDPAVRSALVTGRAGVVMCLNALGRMPSLSTLASTTPSLGAGSSSVSSSSSSAVSADAQSVDALTALPWITERNWYALAIAQLLEWESPANALPTPWLPPAKTATVSTDFLGSWDANTVSGLARLVVQCPRAAPEDKDKDKDKKDKKPASDDAHGPELTEDQLVVEPITAAGRDKWRRAARVTAALFGVTMLQALCKPTAAGAGAGAAAMATPAVTGGAPGAEGRHLDAHRALITTRSISQLVALVNPSSGAPADVRSSAALALVRSFSADSLTTGLANSDDEQSCQEVLMLCGEFDKCVEACFDQRLEPGLVRSVKQQVVRSSALVSMLRYAGATAGSCFFAFSVYLLLCFSVCLLVCLSAL